MYMVEWMIQPCRPSLEAIVSWQLLTFSTHEPTSKMTLCSPDSSRGPPLSARLSPSRARKAG